MKKILFLLLIATVYSCSKSPAEDEFPINDGTPEFEPVIFHGNLEIFGDDQDYRWLNDFHESGYNVVEGSINIFRILDTSICDLSKLENIVEVHGSLYVGESVLSVEIFRKLRKLTGSLTLNDVTSKSLAPLAFIEEVGSIAFYRMSLDEGVVFSSIDSIESVDLKFVEMDGDICFPNISKAQSITILGFTGGGFDFPKCKTVDYLDISSSDFLNLDGVKAIEEVGSFLEIRENDNLETLEALENLNKAQRIWISGNYNLGSLNGLENLSEVSRFEIISNHNLVDYCAVQASVWGSLTSENYFVIGNKYTPSQEELIRGNCREE